MCVRGARTSFASRGYRRPRGCTFRTPRAQAAPPRVSSSAGAQPAHDHSTASPSLLCQRLVPPIVELQAVRALHDRVRPHATTHDCLFLFLILIIATMVTERIIIARPLAIGPRLGPLASTDAARQLTLLGRRAIQSSLEHGRSRRGRDVLSARHGTALFAALFAALFPFPRTFPPPPPLSFLFFVKILSEAFEALFVRDCSSTKGM